MATLYFKVSSDWEQVVKLRQECEKLEAQLKKMDVNKSPAAAKALETQLASTRQQMMGLVTEAAKAGAVMENDLKKKLNSVSKASDELTEEIIKQRKIIRDTQDDVRRLSDEYSKMGKYSPNSKAKLAELNTAKAALNEQRYSLGELQDQQARNRLEVRKLTREYKEFSSGTNNADEVVKSLTDSLKRTAAEIGGLVAIKKFGSDVIEATGKMQQLQVALSTILQDKPKADQLIAEIVQFAAKTPFNLDDVATGAKQLLAYGSSADKVVGELSMLGDVASGLQIPIGQLIYLYGTLRTQGRAMTVDIRQFAGRGIPIYEELAKVLGVTKDQVGELVKEGKVGFKEVEQAFKNMTSEGGKFANLMENSAGTWPQRLSNIEDTLFQKMNEFGNKYKEVFEFGIGTAEDLVESLDDVISVMGGLIAAYGTYKAALIAAAVAQKAVGFVESIRLIAMYRKELGLATAAQQAFNLAAKSNVYVTLLAALVGIGTAVYMFSKNADDATTSQGKLNLALAESEKASLSEQRELAKLKGELSALKKGTDEYNEVKDKIVKGFSKYYAGLDEEIERVGLTEQAYNRLTDAITKSYGARQYEKFKSTQTEELDSLMSENLSKIQERLIDKLGEEEGSKYYTKIRNAILEGSVKAINGTFNLSGLDKETNAALDKVAGKGGLLVNRSVEQYIANILNAIKSTEKLDKLARERFGVDGIKSSAGTGKEDLPKSTISEEINDATKRIKILRQEIADLRSGKLQSEAGKTVESAISAKEKELQSAEKTLETLTGISRKEESKKVTDNQQNLAEELLQLRFKNQQDEINLMEEGSEKKRRQIELDYQKEIDAYKKAKAKYGETDEVKAMKSNADNKRSAGLAALTESENQAAIEANERYLKSYGTFMQKRDAIIAEYTRKISEATTEGDKKILQKEMEKALSSLDLDKLKQGINWELVFGDLDKVSKESLDKVKQQLKDFKNSEEYRNMAIDQKKVIDEALNNIQSTLIDRGGLLGDLPNQLSELADAQEELTDAQEEYNEAMKNGTDEQKEAAVKKLNDAQKKQQNAQTNVQKSTDKTISNLTTLSNVIVELGSNSDVSLSQIGKLASDVVDIFSEAGGKIGGIIGAAFSLLDAVGTQGLDGFIGNVFGSVFKSVGGIWDTLTFGLIGNKESDENLHDDIERLTISNQDLKTALDNLADKMEESSVADASGIYEQQRSNILQSMANTQEMMYRSGAAYSNGFLGIGGSHSSNNKIDTSMSAEDWERVSDAAGVSVTNAGDFWNLTSEQMYNVANDATDLYSKIKSLADDGYENAAQYMDEYIGYWEQLEELEDAYYEKLTSVSFDTVRDDFKSNLLDMESDTDDFAESFENKMKEAIIESMMSDTYSKRLKEWYRNFSSSMEDGRLSDSEQQSLKKEWDSIVSDALAERDELLGALGIDGSSSGQQSASGKGFETMSQDSSDELNGRFTAVYESNLRIETATQQQTVAITELRGSISALASQTTGLYNIADETRTILANSYLELQQIRENTGEIIEPIKKMQKDISEVKKNTAKL